MLKKSVRRIVVIFLGIVLCFSFVQLSHASTVVYFEAIGALSDVAGFDFTILTPEDASVANFTPNLPTGWLDFSLGDLVSALDSTGSGSLTTGTIGSFDLDVTLGNWNFGTQTAVDLEQGIDFVVLHDGADYTVAAIPIPGALLLFGSGLIGIVGVRRKLVKL